MKNNDDMLTRQGDVYTLVDKDGYLVREDTNGERKKYLLEGEGGGGELPENIVTSVNGQTGDVNINIPVVPKNIVNTFNTFTGEVDYPKFVTITDNPGSFNIDFGGERFLGKITYYKNPVTRLALHFEQPDTNTVKLFKDKYVIVKTSDSFQALTLVLTDPTDETLSPWITNKEFVMESNKIYLISCNYPLATIVELENVR
jgi:hypothetical protein